MFGGSNTDPRKVFGCLGTKNPPSSSVFQVAIYERSHMRSDQNPCWLVGWLGYIGDEILATYMIWGLLIIINHYKDPY